MGLVVVKFPESLEFWCMQDVHGVQALDGLIHIGELEVVLSQELVNLAEVGGCG